MLEIYLPIAQVNVDIFLLLFLSFSVGVLSGLFGVGGGFLMTPFLIFMGIPPVYAVPNEVNNILRYIKLSYVECVWRFQSILIALIYGFHLEYVFLIGNRLLFEQD